MSADRHLKGRNWPPGNLIDRILRRTCAGYAVAPAATRQPSAIQSPSYDDHGSGQRDHRATTNERTGTARFIRVRCLRTLADMGPCSRTLARRMRSGPRSSIATHASMTLPHSDACCCGLPGGDDQEAWLDGHNRAFVFFGGVPQSILYDNDKSLVSRILSDGTRQRTRGVQRAANHYLFLGLTSRQG